MTFPTDWPEGCPPSDAVDAFGDVYRMAKTEPPTATDYLSFTELNQEKPDPILSRGLSCYGLREDAEHMARKFRRMGKVVTFAVLSSAHGKCMPTGGLSHVTWWPYTEVDRLSLFIVVGRV